MRFRIDTYTLKKVTKAYQEKKAGALDYARKQFSKKGVHKVEVWDLETLAVGVGDDSSHGPTLIKVHRIGG